MPETTIHLAMERLPSDVAARLAAVGLVVFGEGGSIAVTDFDINGDRIITVYHENPSGNKGIGKLSQGVPIANLKNQKTALKGEGKAISEEYLSIKRERKAIDELAAANPQDPNIAFRRTMIQERRVEAHRRRVVLDQQRSALNGGRAAKKKGKKAAASQSNSNNHSARDSQPVPRQAGGGPQQSGANTLPLGQKPRVCFPPVEVYTFESTPINSQDQGNCMQFTKANADTDYQRDLQNLINAGPHPLGQKFASLDSQVQNRPVLSEVSAVDIQRRVLFINRSLEAAGKSIPSSLFGIKNPRHNASQQYGGRQPDPALPAASSQNQDNLQNQRKGTVPFQRLEMYEPVLMPSIPAFENHILPDNPQELKINEVLPKGEKHVRDEDGQEEPAAKKVDFQPKCLPQNVTSPQKAQQKLPENFKADNLSTLLGDEISSKENERIVSQVLIKQEPEDEPVYIKTEVATLEETLGRMEAEVEME